MFRSHDLADKETVMGLFDTQCLLLTTLPETFRVLSTLSLSARSREMARDGETSLYDPQVNNIVIICFCLHALF